MRDELGGFAWLRCAQTKCSKDENMEEMVCAYCDGDIHIGMLCPGAGVLPVEENYFFYGVFCFIWCLFNIE